jgi:hypothetical protein
MYRDRSNQSGDRSEIIVKLDLIKKGWIVNTPSSRDAVYDLVVDRGGYFETVQVKTMRRNSITKIIDRSAERVSHNGKIRNSLNYAMHNINWLAGVAKTGEIYYYKLGTYKEIPRKSFSVRKWKQDGFPINEVSRRYNKEEE